MIRTRGKNHYLWRRREENAARDSNFRKVIEVGPALCCGRSFRCLGWHALLGANQALVQHGATEAGGRRRERQLRLRAVVPRCFRGSTARCATPPSAGLPAADGECGANLAPRRARSALGRRPPPRDCRRRACIALRCGHRTRVDSHKLVT